MEIKVVKRKKKYVQLLAISIILNSLLLLWINSYFDIFFNSTDDTAMMAIAAGNYTGVPEAHMMFVRYPLGLIMSWLYKYTPNISWYSVIFLGTIIASMSLLFVRIIIRIKEKEKIIFGVIIFFITYILIFLSSIVLEQFTLVAAIAGGTAFYWFLTIDYSKINKKFILDMIVGSIFLLLALCIRTKVMYMVIPFLYVYIVLEIIEKRKILKGYIILTVTLISCILLIQGVEKFAYSNDVYKKYKEYSFYRAEIYDYDKKVEYEGNEEFYNSLGIDEDIYTALISKYNLILDDSLNIDSFKAIVEKWDKEYVRTITFNGVLKEIYDSYTKSKSSRLSFYSVIFLGVIAFVVSLLRKKYKYLFYNIFSIIGALVGSLYFILIGRFPNRIAFVIIIIMAIIEMFLLTSLYEESVEDKKFDYILWSSLILIVLIPKQITYVKNQAIKLNESVEKRSIFENYFFNNKENFYFYETLSGIPNYKTVSIRRENVVENFSALGGWTTPSPYKDKQFEAWKISDLSESLLFNENILYVANDYPSYLINYMKNRYEGDIIVEIVEIVDTLIDMNMVVYKFRIDNNNEEIFEYREIELNDSNINDLEVYEEEDGKRIGILGNDSYINIETESNDISGIELSLISYEDTVLTIYYKLEGEYTEVQKFKISIPKGKTILRIKRGKSINDVRIDIDGNSDIKILELKEYIENNIDDVD